MWQTVRMPCHGGVPITMFLRAWRAVAATVLTLLFPGLLGCGGRADARRYAVSLAVSYQGQPVRVGYVTFEPDATAGNAGPGSVAMIVDGRYRTERG